MKRILSLSLAVCFMIASIFPVNTVQATNVTRNLEAEAVADVKLQETLNKYFELRNEMLLGESSIELSRDKDSPKLNFISQSVYTKEQERMFAKGDLAQYHNIYIMDSSISISINSVKMVEPSVYEAEVYEWTWIWYNDGQGGTVDEMGYATNHTLELQHHEDGSYSILDDLYDDSEIFGLQVADKAIELEGDATEADITLVTKSAGINFNAGLYVDTLIEYADAWVPHEPVGNGQHPEYYNTTKYTVYGSDCANYVSQCLMEGGMQNDYVGQMNNEDWTGSQWWFRIYESADIGNYNASPPAWRVVSEFSKYWTNQGYSLVTATTDTVFPGNPVIQNGGHLMICVGYNAQGVPILNGHNNDKYHVPLTTVSGTLTTIQIIKAYHTTHPKCIYSSEDIYKHTCRCATCGSKYDEAHTWTEFNSMYRCTKCLRTSNVIPVTPNDISNALFTQVQWNEMSNNSVLSIDDTTVLCNIENQYYLVKGYLPDEALRFAQEKIYQVDSFSAISSEHS